MARHVLLGLLLGLGVLFVLDASLGERAWATSRAAGTTAFLAITLDVLFGLFVSTGAVSAWIARARVVEVHRWLSSVALGLVSLHALALVADRFLRLDGALWLGVIAAALMVLLHASFDLVPRIGGFAWRKLHYLSFVVFVAAAAHGIFGGSDSASPGVRALYFGSVASVVAVFAVRAFRATARRRDPATPSDARRASR